MQEKAHILIVDDEAQMLLAMEAVLARLGHAISKAENGQAALEVLGRSKVDLVISDMKMPVMDGLEATHIIRSYSKDIPIIALTAYAFETDKELALEMGCNDFVTKPVSERTLRKALDKYSTIV